MKLCHNGVVVFVFRKEPEAAGVCMLKKVWRCIGKVGISYNSPYFGKCPV